MKNIKFTVSLSSAERTEVLEFEDEATDQEIEETLSDWVWNYVSCTWEEVRG